MSVLLRRLVAIGRVALYVEFALAMGSFVYLGYHLFGDVFSGSPAALPVRFSASCTSAAQAARCEAAVTELFKGRYRITTDAPAERLTLTLQPQGAIGRDGRLLLRLSRPTVARLEMQSADAASPGVAPVRVEGSGLRRVLSLPQPASALASLTFTAEPGTQTPMVLDEVGLYPDDRNLLNDVRPLFAWIPASFFYGTLLPRAIARLFVFSVLVAFIVPGTLLRKINPVLLGLVCFGFCLLDLAILFSPYGDHDLRLLYAGGALQEPAGTNLNVSLWQGFRLLQGDGLTFSDRAVPWSRMPGYGLFCALAGALFGHATILDLTMATVLLQVVFYCVALACLAWAAGRLWPPHAVFTVGLLIALLPKELAYTQVDALIAPTAMLIAAALCLRINATRAAGDDASLKFDGLVHAAFALWFIMRPDVLPGWIAVSLGLHWRNWRRLAIPVVLFLAIGLAWGLYKAQYTHEFALTTSSAGASLFCGLFEVPSRFALTCSDPSYFKWIQAHTAFSPQTKAANDLAVREVLRFWVTFPGHLLVMLDHKMMLCVSGECWPGLRTYLHEALFYLLVWPPRAIVGLLTIMGLCLAVGHERRRTLLFGWPLVFNAPLFWVMFASEGRFYGAIPIALLVAAVPPVFEGRFYARLAARPWRALSVLACAGCLAVAAWPFHDWLLSADALHYWTPFLDPSQSLLSGFK